MSNIDRFHPRINYTSITGISAVRRLPRLGKIRLGIKVKNSKGVEYPKDVDYFVCPPEVQEIYGEKPKELDVLIPSTDPALYFPQALKWYKGARLVCKGDGETATRINMETGNMFEMACPCEHLKDPQTNPKGECTPRANLMLILPKVSMGGAYQIDTGSNNNIININSTLAWIQSMLGRVAWVPLTLKRVPTKIQTPDGATTKALLQLEFKGNMQDAAALRQADWISIKGGIAVLPPHVVDDDGPEDAAGPTLNGNPLTPSDQAEPETVDLTTGEVTGGRKDPPPGPGPEPQAAPYDRNAPSTPPAEGEEPFTDIDTGHGEEAPQKYEWQIHPPKDGGGLVMAANKIKSRDEFDLFRKEFQPIIDQMRPGMKIAVEKAITDRQATLF